MSENTNNEANVPAEVPAHKQMQARFQTEAFKIDAAVLDQIGTLATSLFELCEKHGVPMISAVAVGGTDGDEVEVMLTQCYAKPERVPKTIAACSRILVRQPFINRETGDELIDGVTEIINRNVNPVDLLMAQLGLQRG